MKVVQLWPNSPLGNFNYIVHDNTDAFVIDPFDAEYVLRELKARNLQVKAVINTHDHWDHTKGNEKLADETGCEVLCHHASKMSTPAATRGVKPGNILSLSTKAELEVIETPGHTESHICLLLRENDQNVAVFSGDTLFNAGVGNCKNGGCPKDLYNTISQSFYTLEDNVLVYPGHDYIKNNLKFTLSIEPANSYASSLLKDLEQSNLAYCSKITNIGEEKLMNVFFRLGEESIRQRLNLVTASDKEVFIKLRSLRDNW